jgi:hypothetical protein
MFRYNFESSRVEGTYYTSPKISMYGNADAILTAVSVMNTLEEKGYNLVGADWNHILQGLVSNQAELLDRDGNAYYKK